LAINKKDGIPSVTKGWIECENEVLEIPEKNGIVDGVKKAFGYGKDKESSDSSSSSTSASSSDSSSSSTTSSAPEPIPTLVKKKQRIPLTFTITKTGIPPLSLPFKESLIQVIKSFDTHDSSRRALEEARNELEAFTYKARELLSDDDFVAVSTEDTRGKLSSLLDDAGEWLYGDGYHALLPDVQAKLKGIKDLQSPILTRRDEMKSRPEVIKGLRDSIEQGRTLVSALRKPQPTELDELDDDAEKFTPPVYTPEEIDTLEKTYNDTEKWLDGLVEQQAKLKDYEDPVLNTKVVRKKTEEVGKVMVEVIMKKMQAAEEATAKSKKAAKQKKEQQEKKETETEKEEPKKEEPKKDHVKDEL
jgi:hypoxia up-regulated 1